MANKINLSYVKFKKVSGFTPGPLKPTITTATDETAAVVNTLVQTNLNSDIGSLTKGETIQIVISAGDVITP